MWIFSINIQLALHNPRFCIHRSNQPQSKTVFSIDFHCIGVSTPNPHICISSLDCDFCVVSKKSLPYPRSSWFSPMLSSRRLIVLTFTFRYVIYSKLIFVKNVRSASRFIFFTCASFVEKMIFAPQYCLCFFVKDQLTTFMWDNFWTPSSVPLIYLSILSPINTILIAVAL